jgi:S-DNA-T family DNA segregation ATPase FtsK/SpoIIIE
MSMMLLTVRDGATDVDVEVDAGPTSSVASLIEALPVPVNGRACYVGQTPLNPRGTVADSPLMPGAIVSVGGPGDTTRNVTGDDVGKLRVVSGPDTGLTVALSAGRHRIARDVTAPVCLRDLDVSRSAHAWIEVAPDGSAVITDEGSTNGTFLDGRRIGTAPLRPPSTLRIGGDVLQWTPAAAGVLPMARAADGWLDFNRAYAAVPEVPQLEVTMPDKGPEQSNATQTTAAVTAGLTVVAAIIAAVVFGQAMILLFAAVGAIGFVVSRAVDGSQKGKREADYKEACGRVWSQIQAHLPAEWNVRGQLAPNPDDVIATIIGQRPDLWARRIDSPHGLTLRVGAADQPAAVKIQGTPWPGFAPPTLTAAPASIDLRATGVLGVVGADRDVQDVLRWWLIQLAALRGPDDLRIVVMAAEGRADLAWTRWLPHVHAGGSAAMPAWIGNDDHTVAGRVDELRAILTTRKEAKGRSQNAQFDNEIVVVLDGALALREMPGMDVVLREGPSVGIHLICADRRGMNESRGQCEVGTGGMRLTRTRGENPVTVGPDRLALQGAERLARALTPMRDRITFAQAQNALPGRVRLLDMLGIGTPTPDDALKHWNDGDGPQTRVVLGADANGPTYVDLAKQGPHTMLGGATGAGKSILMQTLVTSLLLANRPDQMNLILVDFKGGSAFLPFEHCPHVVSLIRSTGETAADVFDDAAAARVLASVRAEVSRRESVLARYNGEIDDYWRRRRTEPDLPPVPRLVMVFDEFARVLESSPDFLKELVNVAAKGRSLGMHLVLGTQSLQGKLSAELKNNISLRISLRQNEAADSSEVLGVPDAATIPGTLRGRGMIMCTTDESRRPRTFQCGYLGDPPPTGANTTPVTVRRVDWTELGRSRPVVAGVRAEGPTDQDMAIAAIEQAAHQTGSRAPFLPLLPALPARLDLDDLAGRTSAAAPGSAVPFGLADEPEAQAQPADYLDLAGVDRLMVAGGPQSGRTTFVRTLITSLATRFSPEQVHLYVVEQYRAGLADYEDLPHCGGVFSPAEPDRIRRFVGWLEQEVQRRATALHRGASGAPRIVVVVDGWEHFEDHGNPTFVESSVVMSLREIIATGAPLGVHLVALGGYDMISYKLPTFYSRRLLLPFPKEETRRAHLTSKMASPPPLPGRAVDASTGRHIQICDTALPAADLVARCRRSGDADPALLPRAFPSMPELVTVDQLPPPPVAPSRTWIPLGVGGPDVSTVGIDLFAGAHVLLVSGPSGSGRTTAAAMVANCLRRVGIGVLAVAPPSSPLPRLLPDDAGVRVISGVSIKDVDLRETAAAFGDNPYALVIDDVSQINLVAEQEGFMEAPTLLDECAQLSSRGRAALVLTADATPMLNGLPTPQSRLVNSAVGGGGAYILLTPADRPTAIAHRISLEADQYLTGPPGRGYLSFGQAPMLVQLATLGDS